MTDEHLGAAGFGFTDEELSELHSVLYDRVHYGDDSVVYGPEGDTLRRVLRKVENEAKARGFWWAKR